MEKESRKPQQKASTRPLPSSSNMVEATPAVSSSFDEKAGDTTARETTTTAASTVSDDEDDEDDEDAHDDVQNKKPQAIIRPPSIRLSSMSDDIPIKNSGWRVLPKANVSQINLDKIKRGATLPANLNSPEAIFAAMSGGKTMAEVAAGKGNDTPARKGAGVSFQDVQIRSYRQTISDNPSVSYGPPIGLDWKYDQEASVPLEAYEKDRSGARRPYKKLGLNYYQRKELLEASGSSNEEVKQAQKAASSDKFKRAVTKYFLPAQIIHDAAESGIRKTKRIFGKSKKEQSSSKE